jgi:hypothetical protein
MARNAELPGRCRAKEVDPVPMVVQVLGMSSEDEISTPPGSQLVRPAPGWLPENHYPGW